MTKNITISILFLLTLSKAIGQESTIDTLFFDTQNEKFVEFSGTWYDNIWGNPVMRGTSLSRTKKDSSINNVLYICG